MGVSEILRHLVPYEIRVKQIRVNQGLGVCEFRAIVFNAVSVQIFKKINVPSILPAHKKQ